MKPVKKNRAFTLIELLVVIAILGILSSLILSAIGHARQRAYVARTLSEARSMATALEMYYSDHAGYPADANRNVPPGLEPYLGTGASGAWPSAPWPNAVYDWDNWTDPDTGQKIYQISIRFCPVGGELADCTFPDESWAENFDIDSSVYYCISGACRAHIGQPITYPGYCLNCAVQPSGN